MIVPVAPGFADQTFSCTLGGVRYRLRMRWNASVRGWFLDLYLADGTALVLGKGARVGADILRTKRYDPRVPQGTLFVVPLQDRRVDPGLDAWGSTHSLQYLPAE
jgi:hypothetical protein